MGKVVTIDGPAGSGKSTTAIALARKLGYVYLDTGAMYRALTLKFIRLGVREFADLARMQSALDSTDIALKPGDDGLSVFLDGADVTREIRSNEIEALISEISAIATVREFMHRKQRAMAKENDLVAEGRDLGTFVFPDASVKIYLTADLDERTRRRLRQKNASDDQFDLYRQNLAKRDRIDSNREHSPLRKAADAIEIDTTNLTFEEQVDKIYRICQGKLK